MEDIQEATGSSEKYPLVDLKMRDKYLYEKEKEIKHNSEQKKSTEENITPTLNVHEHDKLFLLRAAYLTAKGDTCSQKNYLESDNALFLQQKSPLGNTLLHMAATYGNNSVVEEVAKRKPALLLEKNSNHDLALHVAASAGHFSTVQKLLAAYKVCKDKYSNFHQGENLEEYISTKNKQGNTVLHQALLTSNHVSNSDESMILQVFEQQGSSFSSFVFGDASLVQINNDNKSALYLAVEVGSKEVVNRILEVCPDAKLPHGKSPLLAAIVRQDKDMLCAILGKKPEWKHLRDKKGRMPLHYAASIGYLEGVRYLLGECASCSMEKDSDGLFPLHLASAEGHVEVLRELLRYCPDPMEMLDDTNCNILHVAAKNGNLNVVRYILEAPELEKMINQKDKNGNSPLHLATLMWHPKIVHAFTWDKRVDLALVNFNNQTALDAALEAADTNPSHPQRLTYCALKSAGTPSSRITHVPPESTQKATMELYSDRIDTLIVVSTLIITVSFASGFTLPGDVDGGSAVMLNHRMFHLYVFSLTISMYGAISCTILLFWARIGELHLVLRALQFAMPLLGISLITLSLAFLAGLYIAISKLTWLATTFLVMGVFFILMVVLLYTFLFLPSTSTIPVCRYISYYPFLALASL